MPTFTPASRLWLICPCSKYDQFIAVPQFIEFLKVRKDIQSWGGFTHSSLAGPSFTGYFWHTPTQSDPGYWEPDENVLIFLDVPRESSQLLPLLPELRGMMQRFYHAVGQGQDVLWITTHPLQIFQD